MPGDLWLRFVRRCLDGVTVSQVIEPLVADWQHESRSARHASWSQRARLAVRWQVALAIQCGRCLVNPLPHRGSGRAFPGYALTLLLGTAAGIAAFVGFVAIANPRAMGLSRAAILGFAAWLLMFMLPIAMMPATMMAVRGGMSRQRLTAMLVITLVAIVVVVGWIGPSGERVRLEATVQERAARGLTTPRSSIDLAMTLPELWRAHREQTLPRPIGFEVNRRAATPVWGLALSLLGTALVRRGWSRSPLRVAGWWIAVSAAMFGLWYLAIVQLRLAATGPWMVVLAVLLGTCAIWRKPIAPASGDLLAERS